MRNNRQKQFVSGAKYRCLRHKNVLFLHKTFELIYDIQKYIDDLPIRVEAINAVVQINDVLDNELCQKEIIVKFKEQITLERICEILELDIRGIEYTYYE